MKMDHLEITNSTIAKIELGLDVQASLDLAPELLDFSIDWAGHEDWTYVVGRCAELGRQTMNLRTSGSAGLVVLRDDETWTIRGWAGVDLKRLPAYPEIFSAHLEPGFQHYLLWLAMHHARLQRALDAEAETLFLRVFYGYFDVVTRGSFNSDIFKLLLPESLDPEFRELCRGCELFDRKCLQQNFMSMDVARMLEHIQLRFGSLPPEFPARFTLDRSKMRHPPREGKAHLEWKK